MYTEVVNGVIWHNTEKLIADRDRYDVCRFDKYDFNHVPHGLIDEAWYWYNVGNYCGDGWILMRKGDKFDLWSCSHCSCYGPMGSEGSFRFIPQDIDELQKNQSQSCYEETKCLFDATITYEIKKMIEE